MPNIGEKRSFEDFIAAGIDVKLWPTPIVASQHVTTWTRGYKRVRKPSGEEQRISPFAKVPVKRALQKYQVRLLSGGGVTYANDDDPNAVIRATSFRPVDIVFGFDNSFIKAGDRMTARRWKELMSVDTNSKEGLAYIGEEAATVVNNIRERVSWAIAANILFDNPQHGFNKRGVLAAVYNEDASDINIAAGSQGWLKCYTRYSGSNTYDYGRYPWFGASLLIPGLVVSFYDSNKQLLGKGIVTAVDYGADRIQVWAATDITIPAGPGVEAYVFLDVTLEHGRVNVLSIHELTDTPDSNQHTFWAKLGDAQHGLAIDRSAYPTLLAGVFKNKNGNKVSVGDILDVAEEIYSRFNQFFPNKAPGELFAFVPVAVYDDILDQIKDSLTFQEKTNTEKPELTFGNRYIDAGDVKIYPDRHLYGTVHVVHPSLYVVDWHEPLKPYDPAGTGRLYYPDHPNDNLMEMILNGSIWAYSPYPFAFGRIGGVQDDGHVQDPA